MTTATQKKGSLREFRIELVGNCREDGSMFVTSPNLSHFSAVLPDGEWEEVLDYLKKFLEANVGKVKSMKIVHDASGLVGHVANPPPAYVLAELNQNARSMRTRTR